jgi:hypothetical protein
MLGVVRQQVNVVEQDVGASVPLVQDWQEPRGDAGFAARVPKGTPESSPAF